jgi:hypothetical protein
MTCNVENSIHKVRALFIWYFRVSVSKDKPVLIEELLELGRKNVFRNENV